jgi:type IV pilus assembly protein PilA
MRKFGKQRGFTIVEIIAVVAIMGILAILVLPTIRVNTIRVKMSEVILAFGPCKAMISELYIAGGESPGAGQFGCETTGHNATTYVDSVTTTDEGVILVSLHGFNDGRLDAHTLTLAPLDNTGNLAPGGVAVARWRCGSPVDKTDILPQYLPASCRG